MSIWIRLITPSNPFTDNLFRCFNRKEKVLAIKGKSETILLCLVPEEVDDNQYNYLI